MVIYWRISYADIADHKSHDRFVYLNTNKLSHVDKILVEIALKKQEIFNNSNLFIPLRKFFIKVKQWEEIPFSEADLSLLSVNNLHYNYWEDQDGNEIDYSQFLSILRGEQVTLRPGYSSLHRRSISEEDLNRSIVWDENPLTKESFTFSLQDIEILKQFCKDAKKLQKTNFLGKYSYPSLEFIEGSDRLYKVNYNVDKSERDAACVIFRRLIMTKEIACFFKVKKIITDKRKNKHTSFDILYEKSRKINDIWTKSGEEIFFTKGLLYKIPNLRNMCWGDFINTLLNHGLFHQKDYDPTQIMYDKYESIINDKETFDLLFYLGVHEIAKQICDFANYIEDILNCLNETIDIEEIGRRSINIYDDFDKFVEQKKGELVFYLSKDNDESGYGKALQNANDILQQVFKGKLME